MNYRGSIWTPSPGQSLQTQCLQISDPSTRVTTQRRHSLALSRDSPCLVPKQNATQNIDMLKFGSTSLSSPKGTASEILRSSSLRAEDRSRRGEPMLSIINHNNHSFRSQSFTSTFLPRVQKAQVLSTHNGQGEDLSSLRRSVRYSMVSSSLFPRSTPVLPVISHPGYMPVVDLSKRSRFLRSIKEPVHHRSTVRIASPVATAKLSSPGLDISVTTVPLLEAHLPATPDTKTVVNALRERSRKRSVLDEDDVSDFGSSRSHMSKRRKQESAALPLTNPINMFSHEPEFMPDLAVNGYSVLPLHLIGMKRPATPTVDLDPATLLPGRPSPKRPKPSVETPSKYKNNPIFSSLSSTKRLLDDGMNISLNKHRDNSAAMDGSFLPIEQFQVTGSPVQRPITPVARRTPSVVSEGGDATSTPKKPEVIAPLQPAVTTTVTTTTTTNQAQHPLPLPPGQRRPPPIYSAMNTTSKVSMSRVTALPEDFMHDRELERQRVQDMLRDDVDEMSETTPSLASTTPAVTSPLVSSGLSLITGFISPPLTAFSTTTQSSTSFTAAFNSSTSTVSTVDSVSPTSRATPEVSGTTVMAAPVSNNLAPESLSALSTLPLPQSIAGSANTGGLIDSAVAAPQFSTPTTYVAPQLGGFSIPSVTATPQAGSVVSQLAQSPTPTALTVSTASQEPKPSFGFNFLPGATSGTSAACSPLMPSQASSQSPSVPTQLGNSTTTSNQNFSSTATPPNFGMAPLTNLQAPASAPGPFNSSSPFSSSMTAASSLFGAQNAAQKATASSISFGAVPTPSVIAAPSTAKSLFGPSSAALPSFGSVTTMTTTTVAPSIFGSTPSATAFMFGSGTTTSASTGFGAATNPSIFGASAPNMFATKTTTVAAPSAFGAGFAPSAAGANSMFDSPPPVFGSTTPAPGPAVFSSPTATVSGMFGSTTTPAVFGASATAKSSVFGVPAPQPIFGSAPTTTQSSLFGAPSNSSAVTQTSAPMFGSAQPTSFGSKPNKTASPFVFGAPNPAGAPAFGGTANPPTFGATPATKSSTGGFNFVSANTPSPFASVPTPFGSSAFSSAATTTSAFAFTTTTASTGFNQPGGFAFNAQPQANPGVAFGAATNPSPAFGTPATNPSPFAAPSPSTGFVFGQNNNQNATSGFNFNAAFSPGFGTPATPTPATPSFNFNATPGVAVVSPSFGAASASPSFGTSNAFNVGAGNTQARPRVAARARRRGGAGGRR